MLTGKGDFNDFKGGIQAFGGGHADTGAGTIYFEHAANRPGRGVALIDNAGLVRGYTDVPPELPGYTDGEADRILFVVRNGGKLRLTDDFTLHDVLLETAGTVLDLDFNTMTVGVREHDFDPGSVINYGNIIWWVPPPGILFQAQ